MDKDEFWNVQYGGSVFSRGQVLRQTFNHAIVVMKAANDAGALSDDDLGDSIADIEDLVNRLNLPELP